MLELLIQFELKFHLFILFSLLLTNFQYISQILLTILGVTAVKTKRVP